MSVGLDWLSLVTNGFVSETSSEPVAPLDLSMDDETVVTVIVDPEAFRLFVEPA